MDEDRQKILGMLSEGKITVEEAERLLDAYAAAVKEPGERETRPRLSGKDLQYMRVHVEPTEKGRAAGKGERINIKIPLRVLRAGVKLSALMPEHARQKVNDALNDKGVGFDLAALSGEGLDELFEALADFNIDVDGDNEKIRIFCE